MWWIHNDSGGTNRVFALNESSQLLATATFGSVSVSDFEDIAIGWGPDPKRDYIYAADFGDNGRSRDKVRIYRFPEPDVSGGGGINILDGDVETFFYRYNRPDGGGTWKRNAEGFAVDPASGDLIIFEKQLESVGGESNMSWVYRLRYLDLVDGATHEAKPEVAVKASYTLSDPITAADISLDGRTIYAKNGIEIFAWVREPGETVYDALSRDPVTTCLGPEAPGEAIGVAHDNGALISIPEGGSPKIIVAVVAPVGLPKCEGVTATIIGTPGSDLIRGTSGPDVIVRGDKKDLIYGLSGGDRICGDGIDDIRGNGGDDQLFGGANVDVVAGGNGNDFIDGGKPSDALKGGKGLDTIEGRGEDDLLRGGEKKDIIRGQGGDDDLRGESGNDKLRGGKGDDSLNGGAGSDDCDQGPGSGPVVNC